MTLLRTVECLSAFVGTCVALLESLAERCVLLRDVCS